LGVPASTTIAEQAGYTFTASATDEDLPVQLLPFALVGAPAGASVVFGLFVGNYLAEDVRCTQTLGRIVLVGLLAGAKTDLELGLVLRKRLRILGTVLRARPLEEKIAAVRAFEAQIVPLFARGALKPVVDCVMPLAEAGKAHERMASNAGFGKIVLTC